MESATEEEEAEEAGKEEEAEEEDGDRGGAAKEKESIGERETKENGCGVKRLAGAAAAADEGEGAEEDDDDGEEEDEEAVRFSPRVEVGEGTGAGTAPDGFTTKRGSSAKEAEGGCRRAQTQELPPDPASSCSWHTKRKPR